MAQGKPTKLISLGFYGGGMMAEAILRGLLAKDVLAPGKISVCEIVEARRKTLATLGIHVTGDAKEMLKRSETVVLAVKPDIISIVLKQIDIFQEATKLKRLYVSIAAGVTLQTLQVSRKSSTPLRKCVRVMPNQPCLVSEAASAFTLNSACNDNDREIVRTLLGACGLAVELPEKHMDAVTGLSGSGPAYVFMMIEAMADGGVRNGLSRVVARQLAVQTVLGAAKMAKDNPQLHPAELRNRVESPGGTTIAGTAALEKNGFRNSMIEAVTAATKRSKELGS